MTSRSRSGSPTKFVTRHGVSSPTSPIMGGETRFQWQNALNASDVMYELPSMNPGKGFMFGTGTRGGLDDENPDRKKNSTGPGSYQVEGCYDSISEYPTRRAFRFGGAVRQNMAMKTPSPGAIYNTEGLFSSGSNKNLPISFPCDVRRPLGNECASKDADMLWPKLPKGPSITIAGKLNRKSKSNDTPGAIYEVHKIVNFKTGPSFSFGKSKASRFKNDLDKLSLGLDDPM